jgi:bifunctional oligoribonuclease and PAP phosphatase NrnA
LVDKDFEDLKEIIELNQNFIISGHENPDPDAICSCIAFEYLLSKLGKKVICISSDEIPINLIPLDYNKVLKSLENNDVIPDNLEKYSLFVIDTNVVNNIGKLYNLIIDKIQNVYIIDHHSPTSLDDVNISDKEKIKNVYIDGNASSVCEMIFRIFEKFNVDMPVKISDALYTGILFDTGSFHYSKTSSETFCVAAKLVEKGTNPYNIYQLLYEQESIEYLKILSSVMSTLKLYYHNQIAVIKMTKKLLEKSGATYDESASVINIPLKSKLIKAVVFCKENLSGVKRISMRSKDEVDVVKLAIELNGGGHKNAAGFKLSQDTKTFEQVIPKIINYLKNEIIKNNKQ